MPIAQESVVNARLAEVLGRSFGIMCRAEEVRGEGTSVRCYCGSMRAVIEASYSANSAEKRAENRVKEGLADMAIAVHYTREFPDAPEVELDELIGSSTFDVKLITHGRLKSLVERVVSKEVAGASRSEWLKSLGLDVIADLVKQFAAYFIDEKEAGEEIERVRQVVREFVSIVCSIEGSTALRGRVADALYKLHGFSIAQAEDSEVIFGQAALAILLSAVLYEHLRHTHRGLKPLGNYVENFGPIPGLRKALEEMLKVSYEPILKLAVEVLSSLPLELSVCVYNLVNRALAIASKPHMLSRDFAGRVYHAITGDIAVRKGFATFYTEIPVAYLLSELALRTVFGLDELGRLTEDRVREVLEVVPKLKIADFACGSGTLLTASLYSVSRITEALSYLYGLESRDVTKEIVEGGIYGFDALKYAAQITAVNLALMSKATTTKRNIYTTYLGYIPSRGCWLGSLELLKEDGRPAEIPCLIDANLSREGCGVSTYSVVGGMKLPAEFDIVVMNPPFTRATGRVSKKFEEGREGLFGFVTDRSARECLRRRYDSFRSRVRRSLIAIAERLFREEGGILQHLRPLSNQMESKNYGVSGFYSIGQAGEGLLFLYLAYKYVKPGGVIAFVLPKNILSGVAWFLARVLLLSEFHLKYVVVSSDSKNGYNFSEGASLSECLIVARRVSKHDPSEETVFVNLLAKPGSLLDATVFADKLMRVGKCSSKMSRVLLGLDSGTRALITKVSRVDLLRNVDNINRFVAFPEQEVVRDALDIVERGSLGVEGVEVPVTKLYSIVETIGVSSTLFHELYSPTEETTPYPIVFGGSEVVRSSMKVKPNMYARLKTKRGDRVFQRFAGRVLVPDRIWVDTAHVVSLYSDIPVLSNIFYVIKLRNPSVVAEKAIALWLNTTWGIMTVLLNREETRGRWVRLKASQWRLLPVIDVESLGFEVVSRLARAFDTVSMKTPRRIPDQFSKDSKEVDPIRVEIDLEFLKAVNPEVNEDRAKLQLYEIYERLAVAFDRWIGATNISKEMEQPSR
ncbi:MAG: hypothetical protein QXG17_06195 [Sulfolobales archaeon]